MMDLDIGMNDWLVDPLQWDDSRKYDRGKLMTADELESGKLFAPLSRRGRRRIPYRTLPGVHPTKGSLLHARLIAQRLCRLQRERHGLHRQ